MKHTLTKLCLLLALLFQCPRNWAERAYPKLIHYHKLDKGGHFPAWEQPRLFVEELRAGFKSLRVQKEMALNR